MHPRNLQAHVDTFLQKHLLILGLNGTRVPVRYSDICGFGLSHGLSGTR